MGNTFKTGNYVNGIFQDTSNNIGIGAAPSGTYKFEITGTSKVSGVLTLGATLSNGTYTYTLPAATGTLALVGGAGVGTVTSVAALTIGTTGTDLSSTVANSTTTPVITLNVPTASATNRGALSSADWTTFNNKQSALTNPVLASGTWTSGYLPKINGTYTIGNSLVQDNGSTVSISTGSTVLSIDRTGGATALLELKTGGTVRGYLGADASMPFVFFNQAASPLMRLDASGNLGLGVTPSAWGSAFKAIQVGGVGSIMSSSDTYFVSSNSYIDASSNRTYITTGYALEQRMSAADGQFQWKVAPSGTAGNAITFTQAMTLGSNSGLSIGTATAAAANGLLVAGTVRVNGGELTVYSGASIMYTGVDTGNSYAYIGTNTTSYGLSFQASGERMRIFSTGNISISSSPTDAGYKLDVNGTGRFTGALSGTSATFSSSVAVTTIMSVGSLAAASSSFQYTYTGANANSRTWRTVIDNVAYGDWTLQQATTQGGNTFANILIFSNTGAATFSSSVTAAELGSTSGIYAQRNGSNTQGSGPYFLLSNAASNQLWYQQLNASNGLDYWYNGSIKLTIASTGAATFSTSIITPSLYGKSYAQTSTSGTTSYVDTGIYFNTSITGFYNNAIYELVVSGNPNGAGSSEYRSVYLGYIFVTTGYDFAITNVVQRISYTQVVTGDAYNIGALTISVVFWNGTTETTQQITGTTSNQIRVKITGYNSGNIGAAQVLTLNKVN